MSAPAKAVLSVFGLVLVGGLLWFFALRSGAPSTGVTAPPIEQTAAGGDGAAADTAAQAQPAGDAGPISLFELSDESSASFEIDEELRGEPNRVVGVSGIVLGEVRLDREDLAGSEIGTVLVNVRDFQTDNPIRNEVIRGPILDGAAFEFIEFTPTSIEGLEGPAEVGRTYDFTVSGDLQVRDVTREIRFDVTATLVEDDRIEGRASTVISREAFGLRVPDAPGVANVGDEVALHLDFVALPD